MQHITSLFLGIILFLLIAFYSILGTIFPQNLPLEFYAANYSKFYFFIKLLGLNSAYSSIPFRLLLILFLINLGGCTIKLLPSQFRKIEKAYLPSPDSATENLWFDGLDTAEVKVNLKKKGFTIASTKEGFHGVKHKFGVFGSTITHIGIIIILLSSFLGNLFVEEGIYNLLPQESISFEDLSITLKLEDFSIDFREDGTVNQYYSTFSVFEKNEKIKVEKIWVNRPLLYKGMNFYQASFGWASQLKVTSSNNHLLEELFLKDGKHYFYQPYHLTIYLYGYYPDFKIGHNGQPVSLTQQKNNPHYAVILYHFGQYIDSYIIEPGEAIPFQDINLTFEDSQLYTGIIYRKDSGYYFVLFGSLVLIFGLLLSFYYYPKYVICMDNQFYAISRKNSWGYQLWMKRNLIEARKLSKGECI